MAEADVHDPADDAELIIPGVLNVADIRGINEVAAYARSMGLDNLINLHVRLMDVKVQWEANAKSISAHLEKSSGKPLVVVDWHNTLEEEAKGRSCAPVLREY